MRAVTYNLDVILGLGAAQDPVASEARFYLGSFTLEVRVRTSRSYICSLSVGGIE